MSLENRLPIVNFPEKSGTYKFAELIIYNRPILRFANYDNDDMRNYFKSWTPAIINDVAIILNETYPLMDFDHGKLGKHKIPKKESEWYSLVGAGYAKIDVENKLVKEFLGKSCVYPGIDYDFLEVMRPLVLPWRFQ